MWKRSRTRWASFRDSCWTILTKSWMWRSLFVMIHPGRKSKYLIHRWPRGQTFLRNRWRAFLSSRGIFSQDLRHWNHFEWFHEYWNHRNIDSKKFGDRNIFMSMFNDIDCNEKNYEEECISNSEIRKLCEEILARTLDVLWTWKWRDVVWFIFSKSEGKWSSVAALQRFVETGYPILQAPVLWIVESWKEIKTKTPFTSQQNLRMWNSYSESFTPRISSVSTEQCRTGLDSTVLQVLSQLHEISSKARQPLTKKRRRVWIQNK